jgi:hypothetical protein
MEPSSSPPAWRDPYPRPALAARPRVLPWQLAYCAAMALLYLLLTAAGAAMAIFHEEMADPKSDPDGTGAIIMGLLMALVCLALTAAYAAAFVLPRRRWAWVYHLVLIAIGLTSCACIPFSLPLLVFWIRPEVQAWYGMSTGLPTLGTPA